MTGESQESFSAADATFTLGITSAGLTGYKFTTPVLLGVNITKAAWNAGEQELTTKVISRSSVTVRIFSHLGFSLTYGTTIAYHNQWTGWSVGV